MDPGSIQEKEPGRLSLFLLPTHRHRSSGPDSGRHERWKCDQYADDLDHAYQLSHECGLHDKLFQPLLMLTFCPFIIVHPINVTSRRSQISSSTGLRHFWKLVTKYYCQCHLPALYYYIT